MLPSVDDAALAAVYRALLKKYHPDVFQGSKEEAEKKTREIIEAYRVLGALHSRSAYDAARKEVTSGDYQSEEEEPDLEPYIPRDWIDPNKIHAERLAKARRLTVVVAGLVATSIIVLASIGQWQQPAPFVASQDHLAQASAAPIPECGTRPLNGAILTIGPRNPGSNIFSFVNNRSGNAIVKVREYTTGAVVASFFVAAGSEASYNQLPNGAFRIQYALGGELARGCRSFIHAYAIYEIPGAESFVSKRAPDGTIHYRKLSYTLLAEPSPAGNSRPNPIDAKDFDAN